MAGVDHHDRVIWYEFREIAAQPLGADRHRVRAERVLVLRPPLRNEFLRLLHPGVALGGGLLVGQRHHARERRFGIAVDERFQRIVAAQAFRLDVDLDRARADLRHRPEMRGHAAGLAADEAHEVGLVHGPVGALARVGADNADRQRMHARNRILAVERGRDRDLQCLRQRHQFGRRSRRAHATARDDDRPLGRLEDRQRLGDAGLVGHRTKRRHARELRLDQRLHLGRVLIHLAFVAAELQMYRARGAGSRHAERLAKHVREARDIVDGRVHLRHRLERRHIVDFLIDLAELGLGIAAAGEGDHRRMRQPGIAQSGREVQRADHLRHADAGFAGCARVAVSHVGGGRLRVHVQPLDLRARLHLRERLAQHRRHHEDVRNLICFEHIGEAFSAAHNAVVGGAGHGEGSGC